MVSSISQPLNSLFYDLKDDIGLRPWDYSDAARAYNSLRLSSAIQAMWSGGDFVFKRTPRGPCLHPIKADAQTYYFDPTIETHSRIGGTIVGFGGGGYVMDDYQFSTSGSLGGAKTRFVGVNSGSHNYPIIRLKGEAFSVHGIDFYGRRIYDLTAGGIGTKAVAGIQLEGGSAPDRGRPIIWDCNFYECEYGIHTLNGYFDPGYNADYDFTSVVLAGNEFAHAQPKGYLNAGAHFHVSENHADLPSIGNSGFFNVRSAIRSENQLSLCWNVNSICVEWQGTPTDCTIFDINRGGYIHANTVVANHPMISLFKVGDWSSGTNGNMSVNNLYWDSFGVSPHPTYYFTLFNYAGPVWHDQNLNSGIGYSWRVRVGGGFAQVNPALYDATKLIQCAEEGIDLSDILVDIKNMPRTNFTQVGHMWKPDNVWNGRT